MKKFKEYLQRTGLLLLLVISPAAKAFADRAAWSGLSGEAVYISDYWRLAAGGQAPGTDKYLNNLDLTLAADLGPLAGIDGVRLFAYGLYNNGAGFSADGVGDAQGVSNIETPVAALRLYEAWGEVDILAGRGSVRAGLYDVNSEFDVLDSAGLFLGSGHGIGTDIGQTGENGPSIFPVTSVGLRLAGAVGEAWGLRLAVLDGVPGDPARPGRTTIAWAEEDGVFLIGEIEYQTRDTKVIAGLWQYTAAFERFDGGRDTGNRGYYLRGERWLFREGPGEAEAAQGLRGFVRLGTAAAAYNRVAQFLGLGVNYRGLFPGRPGDESGLALAWAEGGDPFRQAALRREDGAMAREIALELTHRAEIHPGVTLQPDLQYILNPGFNPSLKNALALGLRLEVAWR